MDMRDSLEEIVNEISKQNAEHFNPSALLRVSAYYFVHFFTHYGEFQRVKMYISSTYAENSIPYRIAI
jgi:hypothetical protein